jgi:predicted  nucleic acid-binding Zn-ribbon protein
MPRECRALTRRGRLDNINRGNARNYMRDTIEKLLILQDRDRNILRVRTQLDHIEPERRVLQDKASGAASIFEAAKLRVKQIETDRKKLELDVEAKKQQIEKYSLQQFQTKKNDEYRALAHEIETCKQVIFEIENQQLDLMEKAEMAQKEVATATHAAGDARKLAEGQIAQLGQREQNLRKELGELEANRTALADAVDESARGRYERLLKSKGGNVMVGVQHGVCGGCHMKLPPAVLVACQGQQELVTCINCGRILYYTRDMDLAVAD